MAGAVEWRPYPVKNAMEGKTMNTYILTINETFTVVVEEFDRRTAVTKAAKALGIVADRFNGKQATKKAVAAAIADGARDLRGPVVDRRALGALVGM